MTNKTLTIILTGLLALLLAGCAQPAFETPINPPDQTGVQSSSDAGANPSGSVAEPDPALIRMPAGLALVTGGGEDLSFFALDGTAPGDIRLPEQGMISRSTTHIAGAYTGKPDLPVVYFQPADFGDCQDCGLWLLDHGQTRQILQFNNLEAVIGVPGEDLIAFVEHRPLMESNILRSSMFIGDPASLPSAQPVLVMDSHESLGIVPVAIRLEAGTPVGIFYTQRPFGIGGEIVFDPLLGLFYLDLVTKSTSEILPSTSAFSSLSPSLRLAAYSLRATDNEKGGIKIRDLANRQEKFIETLKDRERGAGLVVISPDDRWLAWLEVRGGLSTDNFHATIRVGNLDGSDIQDYPQEAFVKIAQLGEAIWVTPLGWLDNSKLLVGVRSMGRDSQAVNLSMDVLTGEIRYLAAGLFVGFLYP
jgi:hypothetical protein